MSANPSSAVTIVRTISILYPLLLSFGCVNLSPPWQLIADGGRNADEGDTRISGLPGSSGGQGTNSVARDPNGGGGAAGAAAAPDAKIATDAWAMGVGGNTALSSPDGGDVAGSRNDGSVDGSGCSVRPCDGVVDSSICWRLGPAGASCAATCASRGGTSAAARAHVGTIAEGGSQRECQRLLGLFGIVSGVVTVSINVGLGCHIKTGVFWPYGWASTPAFSEDASAADVRILCGCLL